MFSLFQRTSAHTISTFAEWAFRFFVTVAHFGRALDYARAATAAATATARGAQRFGVSDPVDMDYAKMLQRYRYFEFHATWPRGGRTDVEKFFANPVNKDWAVHNPHVDWDRYDSFHRSAQVHEARAEAAATPSM